MKSFINFLPPWVETNIQPAFYDKESGTVLQQTARMYAKVNQLVRIANEQYAKIEEYIAKFVELKDYVDDYFDNLDVQEEINNKLDAMSEDGTLADIVGDYLGTKLNYYKVDTTWSQADIQAKMDLQEAKVIEFINGTYDFDTPFRLNSNTKLILNNASFEGSYKHIFYNFQNTDTDVTAYNGEHNIEIIGGKLNAGISFIHGKNILIKDVHFYHCLNDHCIELCACKNAKVEECTFEGVVAQTNDRQYVENLQIENAVYTNFPHGIPEGSDAWDNTGCENITVKNCNFKQTDIITYRFYAGVGGHTNVDGYPHKNVVIDGCTFTDSIHRCIRLENFQNVVITNNKMVETEIVNPDGNDVNAVSLFNGCKDVVFENNFISGFSGNQLYVSEHSSNITIKNNIFTNMTAYYTDNSTVAKVIDLRGVDNIIIDSNLYDNTCCTAVYQVHGGDSYDGNYLQFTNNVYNCSTNLPYWATRIYASLEVNFSNNTFNITAGSTEELLSINEICTRLIYRANNRTGNVFKQITGAYAGGFDEVYGVFRREWTGDTTTLTNVTMPDDYTQFNTLSLTFGSGGQTNVFKLRNFTPEAKLEARTFTGVLVKADGTMGYFKVTLNNDKTITVATTELGIRQINYYNE